MVFSATFNVTALTWWISYILHMQHSDCSIRAMGLRQLTCTNFKGQGFLSMLMSREQVRMLKQIYTHLPFKALGHSKRNCS